MRKLRGYSGFPMHALLFLISDFLMAVLSSSAAACCHGQPRCGGRRLDPLSRLGSHTHTHSCSRSEKVRENVSKQKETNEAKEKQITCSANQNQGGATHKKQLKTINNNGPIFSSDWLRKASSHSNMTHISANRRETQ